MFLQLHEKIVYLVIDCSIYKLQNYYYFIYCKIISIFDQLNNNFENIYMLTILKVLNSNYKDF